MTSSQEASWGRWTPHHRRQHPLLASPPGDQFHGNGQFSPRNSAKRPRAHTQLTPTRLSTSRRRTQEKYFLKKGVNSEECWDFPGGPVVGTLHFHGRGSGSTPGQGIQILQATQCSLCRIHFLPSSHTLLCRRCSATAGPAGALPSPAADPPGLPTTTLQTHRLTRPGLPDRTAPHCTDRERRPPGCAVRASARTAGHCALTLRPGPRKLSQHPGSGLSPTCLQGWERCTYHHRGLPLASSGRVNWPQEVLAYFPESVFKP